jgi:predicted HTH domain antitoxin
MMQMTATLKIELPLNLTLHAKNQAAVEQRSRLLLALKYFELSEVTSGQAARMCGMGRVAFLTEASRYGVPATELEEVELQLEFSDA